jgi:hypothetical protein
VIVRRKRSLYLFVALAAAAAVFIWRCEPGYKRDITRLVEHLESHNSIVRIQKWLSQADSASFDETNRSTWPPCLAELQQFLPSPKVRFIENGAIRIWWKFGDAIGVDIFPPGRRHPRTPMFKKDYYEYHAPYGEDAYIWMSFK